MDEPWRILEFYSGIGGMRYSLARAGICGEVVEAFDINDRANDVYEHNFGHRPFQGNIQTLTAIKLDEYGAHAWLLSPPCQPYTRQGLQKDSADARAFSFVKILELIPLMLHPPLMLFVENVVGFEISDTHRQMMEILGKNCFVTQEYILSPLQFGIPYSRPRYFCLAKRKPLFFQNPSFNNQLLWTPSPFLGNNALQKDSLHRLDGRQEEFSISCEPIKNFLEPQVLHESQMEYLKSSFHDESDISTVNHKDNFDVTSIKGCTPVVTKNIYISTNKFGTEVGGVGLKNTALNKYTVPPSLIERWGSAMDIVYPNSKRCCCFTKSYSRYVKGTGSLLATSDSEDSSLKDLGLRYFTPREVANLHSFPEDFDFPSDISLRQRYALLGNSLSIAVVAPLLHHLFIQPT